MQASSQSQGSHSNFDIVISGGGLSGALMALSLADVKNSKGQSLNIAIVEANEPFENSNIASAKQYSPSFDDRVLALSHHSAEYLDELKAWQFIEPAAQAIKTIHISDRGFYGKARISASEHNVSALGYVIEMSTLGKGLLSALKPKNNISWFSPDRIRDIQWQQDKVSLTLNSEHSLTTNLLLACDGANSVCRRFANITTHEAEYPQTALIANVTTALAHNNVAFERFTEHGPIAMLPLTSGNSNKSNKCSLVWTMTHDQAAEYAALNDTDFAKKLELSFGSWLGEITKVGQRSCFPLKLVQANEQVYHRLALIGNASHTIHPIAGQGFNLGLRDVEVLSKAIIQAFENGNDYSQFSLLARYAEQRLKDHKQIIGLTDSLVALFSNTLPPLVVGRNIGLKAFNYLKPLKKALVNKTMGY